VKEDRCDESALAYTADLLVRDFMCTRKGEEVVITTDTARDPQAVDAVYRAAATAGAKPIILTMPQLPFQGSLADPYISEAVTAAIAHSDVWFDMAFPYMSGSKPHSAAMSNKRTRCLLLADLTAAGITRLFGFVDLDELFALQNGLDELVTKNVGKRCRVTAPNGTDFSYTIGKPATKKLRHTNQPGTYTPPGSAVMYPEDDSVTGTVCMDFGFHEHYTKFHDTVRIEVDKSIVAVSGGNADRLPMERALRRAAQDRYGSIIHTSIGFHPAARLGGQSFIEDIRAAGCNAIGLGVPWWKPGGGENHPDGVVSMQSMWIDGKPVVAEGTVVAAGLQDMANRFATRLVPRAGH
jgi:leucyl aminopeptidase (aminopeptidase T)